MRLTLSVTSFKAVVTAASDLRHTHYFHTLPWGQDGARILTALNFDNYSTIIRGKTAAYQQVADAFALDYPSLKAKAMHELNGMYNAADYPANIRKRFDVEMSIMPLPDATDFRVALSDDSVAKIRANIEVELQRTTAVAMQEPYQRLYDHISRVVERLQDPKGTFRDTLVTGLAELCHVLPALNLTG